MLHRFATFEIDEATRELRGGGLTRELQPRVFDVLVYLARHRDRVVPKDELLDAVWPGVLVTDASLQRAVSLARTALAEIGAGDAIRTHARQGYRLRAGDAPEAPDGEAVDPDHGLLAAGRAAYADGDWNAALLALGQLRSLAVVTSDDLQHWAHAAQCAGRPADAIGPLERGVAAYKALGDKVRAAWCAILIAHLRTEWREPALANGWLQRAVRLLDGEPPGRAQGYLHLAQARLAMLSNDLEAAFGHAGCARELSERFDDADLDGLSLLLTGEICLCLGRIREGMTALDEAGASVVAGDLSPWAGSAVFCGVIFSSMSRADWERATQWTEQFTRWCEGKGTAIYPGLCRLHRAEVLALRGQLGEAESEVRASVEMLALQAPWAEGPAWGVLAEVLIAKGEFATAREALGRMNELGWETHFGFALLSLAQGDAAAAARLLGRSLEENIWSTRCRRCQVLGYFALASAIAGGLEEARKALAEIEADPDLGDTPALQALQARARAELCAAENRPDEAVRLLRTAVRGWQQLAVPLTGAQARCRLAELLMAQGEREAAALELEAAAAAFQQAGAGPLIARCESLRQTLAAGAAG